MEKERLSMEQIKIYEMSADATSNGSLSGNYHIRFQLNDIIIDTAYTFDADWETAICSENTNWVILKSWMDFDEALAFHGKVIYEVLKGKRRFKNSVGKFEEV